MKEAILKYQGPVLKNNRTESQKKTLEELIDEYDAKLEEPVKVIIKPVKIEKPKKEPKPKKVYEPIRKAKCCPYCDITIIAKTSELYTQCPNPECNRTFFTTRLK